MKVRGFTIWELLISLIILSSIVTLVYATFLKAEKNLVDEEPRMNKLETLIWIQMFLDSLSSNSKAIIEENNTFVFYFDDSEYFIEIEDSIIELPDQKGN